MKFNRVDPRRTIIGAEARNRAVDVRNSPSAGKARIRGGNGTTVIIRPERRALWLKSQDHVIEVGERWAQGSGRKKAYFSGEVYPRALESLSIRTRPRRFSCSGNPARVTKPFATSALASAGPREHGLAESFRGRAGRGLREGIGISKAG